MRVYPDQPEVSVNDSKEDFKRFILDCLSEDLPDCPTNRWFLESVNFANMVDSLVEGLTDDNGC